MLTIVLLFLSLGFIGMYFGAKYVVMSLENIASRYGVSQLLIGLTILSIGTSLPEIAISITGGLDKLTGLDPMIDGIVVGNKIGSFLTQITLILGILGLSQRIFVSKWELRREGGMLLISALVFFAFALDGVLNRLEAIAMISLYVAYMIFIVWSEKRIEKKKKEIKLFLAQRDGIDPELQQDTSREVVDVSIKKSSVIFIIGLIILLISAEITILSAHQLSKLFSIPENVVGVLIVGFGTSLPELMADLMAIKRNSDGIAVGDILGSNICDILLATGLGTVIAEFNVSPILFIFDVPMLIIAVIIACFFLYTKNSLNLWESSALIGFYAFYVLLKLLYFQI